MKLQKAWILPVLAILGLLVTTGDAWAQSSPWSLGARGPGSYSGPGPMAAGYPGGYPGGAPGGMVAPAGRGYPGPGYPGGGYGGMVAPASGGYPASPSDMPGPAYGPQMGASYGPMDGGYPAMDGGYGGMDGSYGMDTCGNCGGYGCEACGRDFDFKFLRFLLPYGEGGICAPRWWDFYAEALWLQRDDIIHGDVIFASDGPRGTFPPVAVASASDFDFDQRATMKLGAAMQLGARMNIEGVFMALNNYKANLDIVDPTDNLFSPFSDFGNFPPPQAGVDTNANGLFDNPPLSRGGFSDTDAAERVRVAYSSNFESAEMNFRNRWQGPNCRLQGSWLCGVRYFHLQEDMIYQTFVNYTIPQNDAPFDVVTGNSNYIISTRNDLTGFQAGGDLWISVIPGLRLGGEGKVGIYGNHAKQRSTFNAASLTTPINEFIEHTQAAFMADAQLLAIWRLNYHWSLRGGYQFLYVDKVALAADNFNSTSPFALGGRTVSIKDDSHVFYHGATLGLEYMW